MAHAEVKLSWPGGRHKFRLGLGELEELQEVCNAGPEEIMNRFRAGTWRLNDLMAVLRLGLVGAGEFKDAEAGPKVLNLVKQGHPLIEFKLPALAIIVAAVAGVENDPLGEPSAQETPEAPTDE